MYYCKAGGMDHLEPPLPLRPNLVGYSLVEPILTPPHHRVLQLTMLLWNPETTYFAISGKYSEKQCFDPRREIQHFEQRMTPGTPNKRSYNAKSLGESRSQAVRRFFSLERTLQESIQRIHYRILYCNGRIHRDEAC